MCVSAGYTIFIYYMFDLMAFVRHSLKFTYLLTYLLTYELASHS